jgi:hypothetical protein
MIKVEDFTEEMYNEIREAAKRSLLMLGITADVHVKPRTIRAKSDIEITTDNFNTTPVIYKHVTVSATALPQEVEGHEGIYDLNFYLNYWFTTFDNGHNGASLGELKFRVLEKSKTVRFVGFLIS